MRIPLDDTDKGTYTTWTMGGRINVNVFNRYHDQNVDDLITFSEFKNKFNTTSKIVYKTKMLVDENLEKLKANFKFKIPES